MIRVNQTLKIGDKIRIKNDHGSYKVMGFNRDGSIAVYGGTRGREKNRNFWPDDIRDDKPKPVPVNNDDQGELYA